MVGTGPLFLFLTGGSRFWAETPPRGLERLGERLGDEGVEAAAGFGASCRSGRRRHH